MPEPRDEEAQACAPTGAAQMPGIGEARLALAIHGERCSFRTITLSFDHPEDLARFDNRVRGDGVVYALLQAIESSRVGINVERRP